MHESHYYSPSNETYNIESLKEVIFEDNPSHQNSRTAIYWELNQEDDMDIKQQINTNTEYFDALFARSNASVLPLPPPHPRCYSSCSPSTVPFQVFVDNPLDNYAKSQPHLTSSHSAKQIESCRQSAISLSKSQQSSSTVSSTSAQIKRKSFFLTHVAQTLLQTSNSQCEQLQPLARSCSYKRPQSIKKYRQTKEKEKEKEKEQKGHTSSRKYSTYANSNFHTVAFYSGRKSITGTALRISATDLMAVDDPRDQWSSPRAHRSQRIGKIKTKRKFYFFFFTISFFSANGSLFARKKKKGKCHLLFGLNLRY